MFGCGVSLGDVFCVPCHAPENTQLRMTFKLKMTVLGETLALHSKVPNQAAFGLISTPRKKGQSHIFTYFQFFHSLHRLPLNPHRIPNFFSAHRHPAARAIRTCTENKNTAHHTLAGGVFKKKRGLRK
jgi:hypothetical protein